ncbi:MAG: response regulator [Anaerolineae bacterium]|nr:response regulator [Anaerolineae bacterium]
MATILVIEDEAHILDNVMEILSLEGFDVLGAPGGPSGLNLARQRRPDLILCDIRMPDLDGFGVLDALRGDRATAQIPFVFLTAHADGSSIEHAEASGVDGYLKKPFEPHQLLEVVRRWVA